jgi:hypothetical protein
MAFKKSFSVLLVVLLVSSLAIVCLSGAQAQTISKPSVPQFTMSFEGPSFLRNTTYQLDPNSGQVVADLGFTNQYTSIVLTIKNQPFDSSNGKLYYGIQIKNQNTGNQWKNVTYDGPYPEQTPDSNNTILRLNIQSQWSLPSIAGLKTDIRIQAMLGNFYYGHVNILGGWLFSGQVSDWSGAQTAEVPANVQLTPTPPPNSSTNPSISTQSPTSTQNPIGNSSEFSLTWLTVGVIAGLGVVIALLIMVIAFMNRRIKSLELKQNGV